MDQAKHVYQLDVNNKLRGAFGSSTDQKIFVSSPLPLSPGELSLLLFEKVVQPHDERRYREFNQFREANLSNRGPDYRKIFKALDDVVVAYYPSERHKQPQFFAPITKVHSVPQGAQVIRCVPCLVERIFCMAKYLQMFDGLRPDEKTDFLGMSVLYGSRQEVVRSRISERARYMAGVDAGMAKEFQIEIDQARLEAELEEQLREQLKFMAVLTQEFTDKELADMAGYAGRRGHREEVPLSQLVMQTQTVYDPARPVSYAQDDGSER
jgi:hypothetical protein